ncbi:lysis protein [Salmonella enterica subsp. enterica serovar Poona]|nr:lysis protein [Salmonella enterica subsp. enterica serovar Poona]
MISWIVGAIALAIADRFLLKRSDISEIHLGEAEFLGGFVRVPITYKSRFPFLRGATIRYWMSDARKPTTVVEGDQRNLSYAKRGENCEWLFIPTEYMGGGKRLWLFTANVTHGDSFVNPLYRIFPISKQIRRSYCLDLSQEVNDDRK